MQHPAHRVISMFLLSTKHPLEVIIEHCFLVLSLKTIQIRLTPPLQPFQEVFLQLTLLVLLPLLPSHRLIPIEVIQAEDFLCVTIISVMHFNLLQTLREATSWVSIR